MVADNGSLPFDLTYETTEDGGFISIMPLSGWEGEESEFYTKIHLTVTARYGDPIQGAVYSLYRADNDQLVELLTTDFPGIHIGVYCKYGNLPEDLVTGEDGAAASGILNGGSGYYLKELGSDAPGYILSTEQHPFDITANGSVVSVNIINPCVSGGIRVIKSGDGEELLSGVTFGIYQDGRLVERLTTSKTAPPRAVHFIMAITSWSSCPPWISTSRLTRPFHSPSLRTAWCWRSRSTIR